MAFAAVATENVRMKNVVAFALVAVLACGKDKAEDEGKKLAQEFVAKSAAKDLVELKAAIASPDPGKGKYNCAHMANIADLREADAKLAAELEGLCTKDLYLAMMKVEVEKAEAARKANPDPTAIVSECYNANFEFARDEMKEAKTIDLAKELVTRFEAACPPKP